MPRTFVLRPYAKINLTLNVGPRRDDGFHDVETLLQSIALSDRVEISKRRGAFQIVARGVPVPTDRTNLAWKAADAVWRAAGRSGEPANARVALTKRIPVAAGLGGGSADAAAALVGLNALWKAGLSQRDLLRLAATLGADVPFFLHGGTARGTGRGDVIESLDDIRRFAVVVLMPRFGVSAADAYRWLDEARAGGPFLTAEWTVDVGWPERIAIANDLQEPVSRRYPDIEEMVDACTARHAVAAAMTGSGSAVFGLFRRPPGRATLTRLRRGPWRVLVTRTATRREAERRMSV